MDYRRSRTLIYDVLFRIHHVIGELPTYGYRRRRFADSRTLMKAINAKRVYDHAPERAVVERNLLYPPSKRAHTGRVAVKESNQRWCSTGLEFRCDNQNRESGMEWNGMEWNGMEWNGMEWNGMEWNGMEWNGWNG